jgi:hypothetical protein
MDWNVLTDYDDFSLEIPFNFALFFLPKPGLPIIPTPLL